MVIILQISPNATDKMAHPIHLHGHKFWVLGYGKNETFNESNLITKNNPYRDTAYIPQNGWLGIRFKADNPGVWIFHCHIEWHLDAGMAITINEAFDKIPNVPIC